MKTLYIAVVALNLISVCKPSSLACKILLQPAEQEQDILGRWYLIGMSSSYCWVTAIFNSLLVPSFQVDVTATGKPHQYDANIGMKISNLCDNTTLRYSYETNKIEEISLYTGKPKKEAKGVVLGSRCPDCLVIRGDVTVNIFVILSRRPNVTATEMKEFEAQADCLGYYKPQVLNSDHDFENCETPDNMDPDNSEVVQSVPGRVRNMFSELFTCTTDKFLYYPRAVFGWAQDTWASIW